MSGEVEVWLGSIPEAPPSFCYMLSMSLRSTLSLSLFVYSLPYQEYSEDDVLQELRQMGYRPRRLNKLTKRPGQELAATHLMSLGIARTLSITP